MFSRYEVKVMTTAEQSMISMAAVNDPALAGLQLSSRSSASVSRQISILSNASAQDFLEEERSAEMLDE